MALIFDQVRKRFGAIQALDGVSFSVQPGQVFGFLGANGAGKTTAMRIALDILHADSGTVSWEGRNSRLLPRSTWGYLPEERGLYPRMRVVDQLVFFASLYGVSGERARAEAEGWLARFRIPEAAARRAEELSKGNQQKVQFVAAILHDPDVLILDEPFSGLDPVNVALLKQAFLELRDRGKTLVFSTHQMEMAEELCDAVAIIDRGRLLVAGPVREVKRASGRQLVRLAVEDDADLPWLASLDGVTVTRPGRDYTELEVGDGRDPESVLEEARRRGARVTRFEITDLTLERIFVERVGGIAPSEEERTLAAAPGLAETGGA